jgi:hypothetical protein
MLVYVDRSYQLSASKHTVGEYSKSIIDHPILFIAAQSVKQKERRWMLIEGKKGEKVMSQSPSIF